LQLSKVNLLKLLALAGLIYLQNKFAYACQASGIKLFGPALLRIYSMQSIFGG
jgi:hypothetical protein